MGCGISDGGRGKVCIGFVNLPVEQYDLGLFHPLRGALSADLRQSYASRLKLTSLILRNGALTLRTDQGIDFVDLLYQLGPVSPEDFFIPLRLDDGGNGVIVSFHLPFTPAFAVGLAICMHVSKILSN